MKTFIVAILLFFTSFARADESYNSCTKEMFNLNDWSELSSQTTNCLNSNEDFNNGISALCEPNRSELSVDYLRYLKYKKEYEDTLAWYQALPYDQQQTATARYKLRLAMENWEGLGMRSTIRDTKARLTEAFRMCTPKLVAL